MANKPQPKSSSAARGVAKFIDDPNVLLEVAAAVEVIGDGVWRVVARRGRSGCIVVQSGNIFRCECATAAWGLLCKHIAAVWIFEESAGDASLDIGGDL